MDKVTQRAVIRPISQRPLIRRPLPLTHPADRFLLGGCRRLAGTWRKSSGKQPLPANETRFPARRRIDGARKALPTNRQTRDIFQWNVTESASGGKQGGEKAFDERS